MIIKGIGKSESTMFALERLGKASPTLVAREARAPLHLGKHRLMHGHHAAEIDDEVWLWRML